jgi:hypothetical protein
MFLQIFDDWALYQTNARFFCKIALDQFCEVIVMIINRREIAKAKLQLLEEGFSAYTDSQEVARLLKRELKKRNMEAIEDQTSIGYWFYPVK